MKKIELQSLQVELGRVNEWVRFADQKSTILSAYYSAIILFFLSQIEKIKIAIESFEGWVLVVFFVLFVLTGITFLL